jgi:hypothetical protein
MTTPTESKGDEGLNPGASAAAKSPSGVPGADESNMSTSSTPGPMPATAAASPGYVAGAHEGPGNFGSLFGGGAVMQGKGDGIPPNLDCRNLMDEGDESWQPD